MIRGLIPIAIAVVVGGATVALFSQRRDRAKAMNAPPTATTEAERRITAVMQQARENRKPFLEVPASSGRMLRFLTEVVSAKSVVEIGTSTGYSGLWFCLALVNTGGKLTTFEMDRARAATARQHFREAGVEDRVTLIEGDAHQNIKDVVGPIDVLFLDADKAGYVEYLTRLLPAVRPGGLIIADNVEMAPDYKKAITATHELETVFYGGMSITLKRRTAEPPQTTAALVSGLAVR